MSTQTQKTLLVIDGHSLAFRAFYALPPESFQTKDGQYTNAIHGFIAMLLTLIQQEKPSHLVVAFDVGRESFRNEFYPDYKATRSESPIEFRGQVELLQETLDELSIPHIEVPDFEADDILATLSVQGRENGFQVMLVTGDRDSFQLINDDVEVLYPIKGVSTLIRYTDEEVKAKYGVSASQYSDLAALVGETSDNIPGVPGVGPKTAAKWLSQFENLDGLFANLDSLKGKVVDAVREHQEQVRLNRRINNLVRDMELPLSLEQLIRKPADPEKMAAAFARLQFKTLAERSKKVLLSPEQQNSVELIAEAKAPKPEEVAAIAASDFESWLQKQEELAYWFEYQQQGQKFFCSSFGVANSSGRIAFSTDNEAELIKTALAAKVSKVVFDSKIFYKLAKQFGQESFSADADPLLASWLLQPNNPSKTLADQVERYLGFELPSPPADQLLPVDDEISADLKAWYLYQISLEQKQELDNNSQKVLKEIELPLAPVLAELELVGVEINQDQLSEISTALAKELNQIEEAAYSSIGRTVNLSSPKQLQEVLYQDLALKPTKSTKTGYSTDAETIADLSLVSDHPFLQLLLKHRDSNKLKQITETLSKAVAADNRIHTTFQQIGTTTGRLSSLDPNLQNIPIKTEVGRKIRSAFIHDEAYEKLITADYSQIEMRIMAHLSGDESLILAFNQGEDLHNFVGARIFKVDPDQVTASMRSKVKAMSYGLVYGLSAYGLSRQLRIPVPEAKQLMTDYFDRFGAVREFLRGVVEQARYDGFTETIFGRRRYFPELNSTNRLQREAAERAALNAPIQGTAADIIKLAMIRISSRFEDSGLKSRLVLQVHDELICETWPGESEKVEQIIVSEMESAATLSVPLAVQLGSGSNWDAAAH